MIITFIESLEAYKFFQKLFGNTRRSTYRYVENILEKYESLTEYKYIHNSSRRLNQINTSTTISFMKNLDLGSSVASVRKQFKVPPHVQAYSSKGIRRTILLYKIKSGGKKIKIEAHFYKNQLFYSKYIFSEISEKERGNLLNIFKDKYELQGLDFESKNILDSFNNCAKVENGTEFTISYSQLNNPFFEKVQEKTAIVTRSIPLTYGAGFAVQ